MILDIDRLPSKYWNIYWRLVSPVSIGKIYGIFLEILMAAAAAAALRTRTGTMLSLISTTPLLADSSPGLAEMLSGSVENIEGVHLGTTRRAAPVP